MPQIIWSGQTGCLLPLLIILNLLFGRAIFNSTYLWLGVEAALILIFLIKIHIFMRKIIQQFGPAARGPASGSRSQRPGGPHGRVIDVEGRVVEEEKKLE
ncbi:MAG: hypothetical protein PHC71_01725 [Candidatus Omnitrophica bacterium]|nr:hypothetical protein [Candidatus Omnitrophota bacterium]